MKLNIVWQFPYQLYHCVIAFFLLIKENEDEQTSSQSGGQAPGPQRPRSNSGRELTDEVGVPMCFLLHFYPL